MEKFHGFIKYTRVMKKFTFTFVFLIVLLAIVSFINSNSEIDGYEGHYSVVFDSKVPVDPAGGYTSTPQQMAEFAWKEFAALNWPAATSTVPKSSGFKRGMPDTSAKLGTTGSGGTVVWETFAHRVELYPGRKSYTMPIPDLPAIEDAPTNYEYGLSATVVTPVGVDTALFNNLDEASEITLADMYYTPMVAPNTVEASLLYEAKANNVIYNYVKDNKYQNALPRSEAAANTAKKITNKPFTTPLFELPNGSIEMKATWRRYHEGVDNLADFHHTKAIWYSGKATGTLMLQNDIFLLIGLHIIHKTPSFQTFTFATFEHVSNEKNGFQFVNTHAGVDSTTIPGRKIPEAGVVKAIRQFPIPDGSNGSFNLVALNQQMQKQLKAQFGTDIVWANYELIGIQGQVANNPTAEVPPQTFFLSNFATETNNTLQYFQGGLSGAAANIVDPNKATVFKLKDRSNTIFESFTAGGCVACHGAQAQVGGYDFSVISETGNSFKPEPPEDYPAGPVVNQDPTGYPIPQKSDH